MTAKVAAKYDARIAEGLIPAGAGVKARMSLPA
jgi:hypothetical protein